MKRRLALCLLAGLAACSGGGSSTPSQGIAVLGGPTAAPTATPTGVPTPGPGPTPAPTAPPGSATPAPALAPTGNASFSDANGGFSYVYFVPSSGRAPYPVVLALHGCLQHTADFEAGTRWFEDAQANGYVVVMPQHLVTPALNPNGCWQFWSDHYRGKGEPEVLVSLLRDLGTRVQLDAKRTYVAGLSSGGAMAVALAADYPDVFAAAAVGSGTEYQPCISDNVYQCYLELTNQTFAQDPTASGKAAYAQSNGTTTRPIPTILFQGDVDTVVAPFNLTLALTSLATMEDGIASHGAYPGAFTANPTVHDSGTVPGGHAFDHYSANGGILDWTIVHGMNHAWSGGLAYPASNASDGNNYNDPKGPNATIASRTFLFRYSLP